MLISICFRVLPKLHATQIVVFYSFCDISPGHQNNAKSPNYGAFSTATKIEKSSVFLLIY